MIHASNASHSETAFRRPNGKRPYGGSLQATSDSGICLEGSHGLELWYTSSQPPPCSPGSFGEQQGSKQGYKKLFFDCNLHVVLHKLLGQCILSGTEASAHPSGDVLLDTKRETKHELSDAEITRLMRQHLHIFVASQGMSDDEVFAAAKVLEQQLRVASVPYERESENQAVHTLRNSQSQTKGDTPLSHGTSGVGNFPGGALRGRAQSSLEGFCVEASVALDEFASNSRSGHFSGSAENLSTEIEQNAMGLLISQSREAQTYGTARYAVPAEASTDSKTAPSRCSLNFSAKPDGSMRPAKKVCVEQHDVH